MSLCELLTRNYSVGNAFSNIQRIKKNNEIDLLQAQSVDPTLLRTWNMRRIYGSFYVIHCPALFFYSRFSLQYAIHAPNNRLSYS